jgi:CHAT domain-containing protein/Tfp pilus assembly protein PilF
MRATARIKLSIEYSVIFSLSYGGATAAVDNNSGSATSSGSASRLTLGESRTKSMSAGQESVYTIDLAPGSYLLSVEQGGLDLTVTITGPTSHVINSPTLRVERETALLRPMNGNNRYTIALVSDEYTGAIANYTVSITELDDATAVAGYRRMTDAAVANNRGGDEGWQEALSSYTDALSIWRRTERIEEQARALLNIGYLHYWQFSSWNDAATAAADAAVQYARIGKRDLSADAIHLQAASLIEEALVSKKSADSQSQLDETQGIFDDALRLFETAREEQAKVGNYYGEAQALNNIGLTYYYMDDWPQASLYFEQAAIQFRNLKEWSDELNPLANLGVIDFEQGRYVRAIASFTRLLELIPVDQELDWRADTLDNLGAAMLLLGQIDGALRNYFAALSLHEALDSEKGQGRSLTGIGSAYYSIGEMGLAQQYFDRALPLRKQANDGRGQISVLHYLGDVHRHLGRYELALQYHDQALDLAATPISRSKIQILQARDWIDAGSYVEAAETLRGVGIIARDATASAVVADASYELGRALARSGNSELAQSELQSAHDLYQDIGMRDGQARSLLEMARIKQATDPAAAVERAYEAIEHIEQLRSRVANPELRAVYLSTRRDYYEFLIDTLLREHETAESKEDSKRDLLRALAVAERARARATADLMREATVDLDQGTDPAFRARQLNLYDQLAENQNKRDRLLEQGAEKAKVDEVVSTLQDVHTELDVLEIELRQTNPRFAILSDPEVLKAHQIQAQIDEDSVVLQYWLGDVASYLWIVSRTDVQVVRISDRNTVNQLARRVYERLSVPEFDRSALLAGQAALAALSDTVIGPAAEAIRDKNRVIVAADGALQYVPFSLLSPDGSKALIETHEVVVVPSMTVLAAQRLALADRARASKTLAVFGDPVFENTDRRVTRLSTEMDSSNVSAPAYVPGYFDTQETISRLPFSATEVEHIAELVPDSERLVATGFAASKDDIVNDVLAEYRFVHLATHGLINATHPSLSTLVFSLVDASGSPQNGYLRLHDIYDLELTADLVVLSACETGLGREIRGEGLIGLTQGFMYAGAKSVIASLWQVSDQATAELMTRFYKYLLEEGQTPAAALRHSQMELASEQRWRNPYFWSGFVLQGDWL